MGVVGEEEPSGQLTGATEVYTCNETEGDLLDTRASDAPDAMAPHPNDAKQLPLQHRSLSPEADSFVEDLLRQVELREDRRNRRGPKARESLREAVRTLIGGLLLHTERYGVSEWSWMQTSAGAFSGTEIGYRQFRAVEKALLEAGLLEKLASFNKFFGAAGEAGFGATCVQRFAARFRGTGALWNLALRHGIAIADAGRHFARQSPEDDEPVYIKALSTTVAGRRISGQPLPLPISGEAAKKLARVVSEVQEVNKFIASRQVDGCDPITLQRGYSVDLEHGGRWYTRGNNYQNLSKEDRLGLLIDGEPVAEVDVRASHLTILIGRQGQPLPEGDPYDGLGFPREIVKAWIVATFGSGAPATRWSPKVSGSLREAGISLKGIAAPKVAGAVLKRYPFMAKLPPLLGCVSEPRLCSLRLMNLEAEALTTSMHYLRVARNVLALPMHDSLIVPRRAVAMAEVALQQSYRAQFGLYPSLSVRQA